MTTVEFDKEQALQLYCVFTGDVERTAHALGVRPVDVLRAADELGWNEKLAAVIKLQKSGRPGDIERAISRALNFVQAHKLRLLLERVIFKLSGMSSEELDEYIFREKDKNGLEQRRLTTRALADLASAVEKCQMMTYQALDDTAKAREKRIELGQDGDSSGAIHAAIAKAMSQAGQDSSPRAALLEAQIHTASALAQKKVEEAKKPVNPNDNDEH